MAHLKKTIIDLFSVKLCGFGCANHPAAPGSNPKQTMYTFFNFYCCNCYCNEKMKKINEKEAGIGPFKKNKKFKRFLA